jgi:hypothetical protein
LIQAFPPQSPDTQGTDFWSETRPTIALLSHAVGGIMLQYKPAYKNFNAQLQNEFYF